MTRLTIIAGCLLLPLLLSACGFHPMYGSSLAPALSSIYVEPIAERDGYELRNTLIDALQSDGTAQASKPRLR
jgi:LPS-assembly lipoprotein